MGKSSAPAPDYAAAAQAQGVANRETAQFNAGANRVNQIGPQGSSTWTIRPGADLNNPQPGDYIQTTTLSPDQQRMYDQGNAITGSLLNTAVDQLGRVQQTFGTQLDTSGLPGWRTSQGGNPGVLSMQQEGWGGSTMGASGRQIPPGYELMQAKGPQAQGQGQPAGGQNGLLMTMQSTAGQQRPDFGTLTAGARSVSSAGGSFGGSSGGGAGGFAGTRTDLNTGIRTYPDGSTERLTGGALDMARRAGGATDSGLAGFIQSGQHRFGDFNGDSTFYAAGTAPGSGGQGGQGGQGGGSGAQPGSGAPYSQQQPDQVGPSGMNMYPGKSYGGGGFGAYETPGSVNDASRRSVENAILSRLEPQFRQDSNNLQAQLAARGLEVGSPAYTAEMDRLSRQQADNRMQAILAGGQEESRQVGLNANLQQQAFNQGLQGATFDNQARAQILSEMLGLRNLPLNELNALRTGSQVSMPQFGGYYTNNSQAAPVFDAAVAQGNYNAQQAANNQGGLGSLIGAGAQLGSAFLMSDIRLKKNLKRTGTHPIGVGLYTWDWKDGSGSSSGVVAQELQKVKPSAVARHPSGYLMVDYSQL